MYEKIFEWEIMEFQNFLKIFLEQTEELSTKESYSITCGESRRDKLFNNIKWPVRCCWIEFIVWLPFDN